eukprot:IDg5115t1
MAVINFQSDILDLRTSRCASKIRQPSATHIISMTTPGWMETNSKNGSIGGTASQLPLDQLTIATEASVEDAMVVSTQEARDICTSYSIATYLDTPATPVTQFLNDIAGFQYQEQLRDILNSPCPYDDFRLQERASNDQIQQFYDARNAPVQ